MQGVAEDHWQDTYDARLVVPLVCSNPPSRVARHPSSRRTSQDVAFSLRGVADDAYRYRRLGGGGGGFGVPVVS